VINQGAEYQQATYLCCFLHLTYE